MPDIRITAIGNLVGDPELRFTQSGTAVCNFRIASTPRTFDKASNAWVDGETIYLGCAVWREAAQNAAESLVKGQRVIVTGALRVREYETSEGVKQKSLDVDVEEVGPSIRFASGRIEKNQRPELAAVPSAL